MTGKYIVAEIKNLESIPNADRIVSSNIYGETVIVSVDTKTGDKGILVDCECVLDKELVSKLNMFRDNSLNEDKSQTGYIEKNCRVRPITLKGVKCSGLFLSEKQLNSIGIQLPNVGVEGNEINGVPICSKYIPPRRIQSEGKGKNKEGRISLKDRVPTFKEHFSTDQWGRNTHKVQEGDLVIITEKLHGTSIRFGNMPVLRDKNWFERFINKIGIKTKETEYKFVTGSRRVVKSIDGNEAENKAHYYGHDLWTEVANREFKDKLRKGETIYGEIVGFDLNGQPIMGSHNNSKLKKFMSKSEYKEFINKYGETTEFTYGCVNTSLSRIQAKTGINLEAANQNKVFIYRITMTNEDGESIDLSWEQVKARSEQLGVAHVPELFKVLHGNVTVDNDVESHLEFLNRIVEELTESDSKNFPQHINEGVCVRIENGSLTPQIFKSKRFYFKVLENIIKDSPENLDIEETN